jgi:FkbM family methyltransferase
MTFISYAQNFEDVMLFRALKGIEKGFYIDIGAQDPVFDSVTKAFYERGWRGINIEPVQQWFQKLVADRPEDINLRLAAWSTAENLRFFEVQDTGMSTADADIARRHAEQGLPVREYEIPARPLDAICAEFGVKKVHFLKIDAEGAEAHVLGGISLVDIRPWIILVEATEPNSQITTHGEWEHLLTERGYDFAYFDGLNRFYVAEEQAILKNAFSLPPNYFDYYTRYSEWWAQQRASRLEAERQTFEREAEGLRGRLEESRREGDALRAWFEKTQQETGTLHERVGRAEAEREALARENDALRGALEKTQQETGTLRERVEGAEAEREALRQRVAEESRVSAELRRTVEEIHNSLSMRITAPVRAVKRRFPLTVQACRRGCGYLIRMPKQVLRSAARQAVNRPVVHRLARKLLARWPRLRWRLKQFVLLTPEVVALRGGADGEGPPRVAQNAVTAYSSRGVKSLGEDHLEEDIDKFAVIESMHPVVDVEALRARIRGKTQQQ